MSDRRHRNARICKLGVATRIKELDTEESNQGITITKFLLLTVISNKVASFLLAVNKILIFLYLIL